MRNKYTSKEAAKILRQLQEKEKMVIAGESASSTFNAALGEDVESVRPAYDFEATNLEIINLQHRIIALKHAINVFNATYEVPDTGLTIDQILVRLPQLSSRKQDLYRMAMKPEKKRARAYGNSVIDYEYANYDIESVAREFKRVTDELDYLQLALDTVNSTVREISIDS